MKRSRQNKLKLWNQSQICSLCGERIEDVEDATWDHIIPRSKGGADSAENLALAHSWCNGEKGDLSPWVYRIFRFLNIALFKVRPGRPSKRLTKAWKDSEDYSEDDSQ